MTEGTRSLLIGCHSFIMHPLMVIKAWRWWFGHWPKPWQIICIVVHDWGVAGRQYLSNNNAKYGHWMLGAVIAKKLFGDKGSAFVAGHTPESSEQGWVRSDLWYADKASWLVAPLWWLWLNYRLEKFQVSHPHQWRVIIAKNLRDDLASGGNNHFGGHQLYLDEMKDK